MGVINIPDFVRILQESGTESWNVEVKSAAHGLPDTIDETLSAFANMPEGGTIILGVSEERDEMFVTGVSDPNQIVSGLATKAREKIVPAVQLGAIEVEVIEDQYVVACVVPPQPSDHRPFRVGKHGPAFTRSGDGDHQLSEQEELYLVSQRQQPTHDREPVAGADVDYDLVPELLEQYLAAERQHSVRLRGMSRDELLIRTNVVDHETGLPTVAAVYSMGIHPQQFLPHTAMKAHARPLDSFSLTTHRFSDKAEFAGPVPDLLELATDWVHKHLMHAVNFTDGHGYNESELPLVAVREVVANALVHRDLSAASFGSYPMLVKLPTKFIVENPGGLWGLTQRELGKTSPRARNAVLYRMCSALTTESGKRVIEGHATGIPEVIRSLNDAFSPAPDFQDEVIKFRVLMPCATPLTAADKRWLAQLPGGSEFTVSQKLALIAMKDGERLSIVDYRSQFSLDAAKARDELQQLVRFGLAEVYGSGREASYCLARRDGDEGGQEPRTLPFAAPVGRIQQKVVETADPKAEPSHADKILAVLHAATVARTRKEVAASTGLSAPQVYRALKKLQREERVVTEKDAGDGRVVRYRLN